MKTTRIYDGALFCPKCNKCPVADYEPKTKTVRLHDPAKPENGAFTMTAEEFNTLLANAKPVSPAAKKKTAAK